MEAKLLQTILAIVFANRALRPGGTYGDHWDLSQPTFVEKQLLKVSTVFLDTILSIRLSLFKVEVFGEGLKNLTKSRYKVLTYICNV